MGLHNLGVYGQGAAQDQKWTEKNLTVYRNKAA